LNHLESVVICEPCSCIRAERGAVLKQVESGTSITFLCGFVFRWPADAARLPLRAPPPCQNGSVSTTVFRCVFVVE
jgi:hypothetical protein